MIEERQVGALLEQADRSRRARDFHGALGLLRRALSIDPEHAHAHASLALALLGMRRLHGASIESELALAFDGNSRFCHYTAAAVKLAKRELDGAWEHVLVALHDDAPDADIQVLAGEIRVLQGQPDAARTLFDEALAADPDHVSARSELARLELTEGNLAEARLHIQHALEADPSNVDAHVVAGYVALRAGDVDDAADDAERHVRFALTQDAGDRGALELWTAIKAHRSFWLGLWWRANAFVSMRSERGQLAILIGSFLVVRLAIILLGEAGYEDLELWLGRIWLGFCAYTWFAPAIFRWMLDRELTGVTLRDDY